MSLLLIERKYMLMSKEKIANRNEMIPINSILLIRLVNVVMGNSL